ncbi:MAG: glycosyltransferase [Pseudomonadota bacterium]
MERKKILFVAEAVTMAHVGRLLALARELDAQRFAVHFACADGYDFCFADTDFTRWRIDSISSEQFLATLAAGKPVYRQATLLRYVEDDLRVLNAVRPDVVVGDFRLSLSVSARLAKVPYVAVINAYWSPFVRQRYTVPTLPLTRFVPIALANPLFQLARPVAFASHAAPLNQVRTRFGLAPLGQDLRRVYTDADHTLYADLPELFRPVGMPPSHSYLGPVLWSPPVAPPSWWHQLPEGKPIVYVTLGSSGQGRLLAPVLRALAHLPITVVAATAGKVETGQAPANAHVAAYLPGEAAARRARLVICNGGSPTSQQALAAGVPVLGIASNLDQYLNMNGLIAAGAGALLRADRLNERALRDTVKHMLADQAMAGSASRIGALFAHYHPDQRLLATMESLLASPVHASQ